MPLTGERAPSPLARVVATGGGTAGHVVPTLPVIESLRAEGAEVHFIGGVGGLEAGLVAPLGIPYHAITTGKLRRYFSLRNVADCVRVPVGVWQAWRLLGRLRPDVVFSKGGFVSFPVALGAWLRGIPVVAHESDLTPGLAYRLAAPFVATLCVNFDGAETRGPAVVTGMPVRSSLLRGNAARGRERLGFAADRPLLLVVGGSLGAARLNAVVRLALDRLLRSYNVAHVCGRGKIAPACAGRSGYVQLEYVDDAWGDVIAAADLVVSRAGAGALYEWLALGKPHLLVPLPKATSRGDQIENADFAQDQGWSLILREDSLTADSLVDGVARLARAAPALRQRLAAFGRRDSVAAIVAELTRAVAAKRS